MSLDEAGAVAAFGALSQETRLRMVRAVKNRFGPVDEIGCFDLSATGIVAITDPTGLFLEVRDIPVPGTANIGADQ